MDDDTKALYQAAYRRTLMRHYDEYGMPPKRAREGFEEMFKSVFNAGFEAGVEVKHDSCAAEAWEAGYTARGHAAEN